MEVLNKKFLGEIANIKDPVVFFGICVILKVDMYEEEEKKTPREFSKVLADVMSSYEGAGRKRKRELLRIVQKANKEKFNKEILNGSGTENTETAVQDEEMREVQ